MRAKRPWLTAMVVLVGSASCRVREPEPPPKVAVAPARSGATEQVSGGASADEAAPDEAAPEPEAPEVADPPAAEPEPVTPPQSLVPIATSFSPTALVVQPVRDASPVVLFADERAAMRLGAGKVLARQGVELVPVPELERIEAAAAEGRLVLEGDQRCRAPLTPAEVAARYFPGRPQLTLSTDCFDDCRLNAFVSDPPKYEDSRAWQSPRVSRPHDPKAWLEAAGRLRATDAMGIGGLGLFGTSHSPPVRFNPPVGIGPWAAGQPEEAPFGALEGIVASCAHPDPLVGFTWQMRASVDRRGRITRCTAETDSSLAQPSAAECLCEAVETIQFEAAAAGRRLRVEAIDDGGFGRNARLELVQPGTETWVTRMQEAPALARCIDANPLPGSLSARVILALAPDGAIDDVRIEGDITTSASMGLASCLVKELRRVPLPCRPPGIDALHLALLVNSP